MNTHLAPAVATVLATAAFTLAGGTPGWAASREPAVVAQPSTKIHDIGSCRASGDYAICVASGSINQPLSIEVHVSSAPDQQVTGAWDMVCSKGSGAGSKSGNFHGMTTLNRKMRMPYKHPDSCDVSADAQLATGGNLHVWITALK